MKARTRTFTLTLTEPQYHALSDAIALAEAEDDDRCEDADSAGAMYRRQRVARKAAWRKIVDGWYGEARQ